MERRLNEGDRVIVTLVNGTSYEANVKRFSETFQRLSLRNITQQPGNITIKGSRNFEGCEIAEVKFVESPESSSCPIAGEAVSNENGLEKNGTAEESVSLKISESDFNKIKDLQNSFSFFDSLSTEFYNALTKIKESRILGVHAKDASKGRSERISVIVVSTATDIFIFDVEKLGDEIFDKGLRDVLGSKTIKKVVYDCRLLSDCLYHRHQVQLLNVRDIEAEDIMIVHQERGYIRKHSRPFGYLIQTYLGIPHVTIDETNLTESWSKRPLGDEYKKFLATFASLLMPMHEAIEQCFIQRLIKASEIYNEYIRDSDSFVFVSQDYRYVLQTELKEVVKRETTCRGIKLQ